MSKHLHFGLVFQRTLLLMFCGLFRCKFVDLSCSFRKKRLSSGSPFKQATQTEACSVWDGVFECFCHFSEHCKVWSWSELADCGNVLTHLNVEVQQTGKTSAVIDVLTLAHDGLIKCINWLLLTLLNPIEAVRFYLVILNQMQARHKKVRDRHFPQYFSTYTF